MRRKLLDNLLQFLNSPSPVNQTWTSAPRSPRPQPSRSQNRGRAKPYHEVRGWIRTGDLLTGYYEIQATPQSVMRWAGSIRVSPSGIAELFIHSPPSWLKQHPKWICFHARGQGRFWVHFYEEDATNIDASILRLERILKEAYDAHYRK